MKQQHIWLIIGLMSAAVIGLVWLQLGLIRTALKVNEERFDKNVYNALNEVAQRLETQEAEQAAVSINGLMLRELERDAASAPRAEQTAKGPVAGRSASLIQQLLEESGINRLGLLDYLDKLPLEQRIPLNVLNEALKQELANHGINSPYEYGVYSDQKQSFIILNGHYVVEDSQPKETLPGYRTIFTSEYQVTLFDQRSTAPGRLLLHFPEKGSVLWSSLWLNLSASVVFALLILLCFGYTIMVILRQKKVSEMKTDFINNMTHEFKTPIATISLAADSITSPRIMGNADKVLRFANIIKQENKRMNSQVEKVLQMARIDKRELNLKLTDVDLHEVIEDAVEYISLQVEPREGQVRAVLEAANPVVEGDLTHISNVINNLLDNANKYSPEKPDITVQTRDVSGGVEVVVQDKGIGMSKESRKHIFDKFYRVHTGNLHDVKGFGLGLSYVKAIMTGHRGAVDVKSELGKGSSFILFFPYRVEERS